MAYDGWMEYNGIELLNVARTSRLSSALGLGLVRVKAHTVELIETRLGVLGDSGEGEGFGLDPFGVEPFGVGEASAEGGYDDITEAPWYDPDYPASAEFAGFIPLAVQGLDDSTLEANVVEYVTDGGRAGSHRSTTLPIVFNLVLVGSTERGVEFGKRWLDRLLRRSSDSGFCSGTDLTYFRYAAEDAPKVHRRDVALTRGSSVTRKRNTRCAVAWTVTFTLTAADPYEYGEEVQVLDNLGGTVTGPGIVASGNRSLSHRTCPTYDYSPIFDPMYPALVESPQAPDFYPTGWVMTSGMAFTRHWARVQAIEPSSLLTVPVFTITSPSEARMVRVSIWPGDTPVDAQCDPLFSAVLTYVPSNQEFVLDGEQRAAYVWDGSSPMVRRSDSLVYAPEAKPVEWAAFNDHGGLLVALDQFGSGGVRASLALVPKSD